MEGAHRVAELVGGLLLAPADVGREDLRTFTDAAGREQPIEQPADWRKRREQILAGMQEVMGPLPGPERKVPFDVEIVEAEELPRVRRMKITYAAGPGDRIPAYLLIPQEVSGRAPAMLCLHGTGSPRGRTAPCGSSTCTGT